ncbi:MAG: transglutaminase family protein [Solirubrobacteraceae bacterium]|nr:transglutaminase family protein [Solirubrobacteraceae bacterium]
MNFQLRYLTEYRYEKPVSDNLNSLRVRPATTSSQRCDDFSIRVEPEARMSRYADYFGTEVIEFGIARPHDHLVIDVRARVVTSEQGEPPDAPWEALEDPLYREAGGEFLLPTGDEPEDPEPLDELDRALDAPTPLALARKLVELIPDRFEYDTQTTYVGSTVEDLLEAGGGVCQDFVHLSLILLRRRGIAARYVSGYLWAAPQDGSTDSVEVDTHAWLEALLPGEREPAWIGWDPTNRRMAGETHVKIGHGRRYSDVPPIKGVYAGSATSHLEASVQMSRLDPAASARP